MGEIPGPGQSPVSPFQLVDALLRSHLGVSLCHIGSCHGYGPPGSLTRTRLAVSRLIDLWSLLGIQLHVFWACPSRTGADPAAYGGCEVQSGTWRMNWSEEAQTAWLEEFVPMIAAKPAVTGVILSSFRFSLAHRYPHSGLLRPMEPLNQRLKCFRDAGSSDRRDSRQSSTALEFIHRRIDPFLYPQFPRHRQLRHTPNRFQDAPRH